MEYWRKEPGRGCDGGTPPRPTGRPGNLWDAGWAAPHLSAWSPWTRHRSDWQVSIDHPAVPVKRCPRLDAGAYEHAWLREFMLYDAGHPPVRPWPPLYRDVMITLSVEKSLIEQAKHEARRPTK